MPETDRVAGAASMGMAGPRPLSPWHAGEIALQKSLGLSERLEEVGRRVIRGHMPEQHRLFFQQLPFVVLGAVDRSGDVWATVRAGERGFLQAPDPGQLQVELGRDPADPADAGMNDGDAIAVLGIDLTTRRRNRLNGTLRRSGPDAFRVEVAQSYGNCPQYIQQRHGRFLRDPRSAPAEVPMVSHRLDSRARTLIARSDTFYVASYVDPEGGGRRVDVSHRGGRPGFVRPGDDGVLAIPDFAGNGFFNTLGNMLTNPRAGLVFVDDATGSLLQMTGRAEVVLDSSEIAAFRGAERMWSFEPRTPVYRAMGLPLPLRLSIEPDGWSPSTMRTGSWTEAADPAAQGGSVSSSDPAPQA